MKEYFNFIDYSDPTKFKRTEEGRIQLAGYPDELMLYASFDNTLDADYAISDVNGDTTGNPVNENFGVFSQHISFVNGGTLSYSNLNFTTMTEEGSIKFRVKTGFYNGYARQDFAATTDPTIAGDTNYEFRVYVNDTLINGDDTVVFLQVGDTMSTIRNAIYAEINAKGATAELLDANNIRMIVEVSGDSILVTAPNDGNNLITLLSGIGSQEYPNPPASTAKIFDVYNGTGDSNRITLKHKGAGDSLTAGNLLLEMYDSNGDTKINTDLGLWNLKYDTWYALEFNWNKSIYQLFIDGTMAAIGQTGFTRTSSSNKFIFQGDVTDWYRFDELIIYNKYKNLENYTVATSALGKYATDDPYVDVYFGTGFQENEITDLNLKCSSTGTKYVVKLGNIWYYYTNGAWRQSDATYSQSTTPAEMENKFTELVFSENLELIIRVFFHSDGSTQVYIDEIDIVTVTGDSEGAIIIGTIDLSSAVNLSTLYNILITTNLSSATVNCKAGAGDSTAVTLAEIKNAIDTASISGLIVGDSNNYLTLQSSTKGTSSYVAISGAEANDAISLIWGFAASDYGAAATGLIIDYSELFRWVRAKLGEPTIPVEVTDEQIEDCLEMGVHWYNYWRNADESIQYTNLSGNNTIGYDIPATIDPDLIMEIILKPRFPFMYYQGREDLITNLYMQYLFQRFKAGYTTFLTDYYITMSTEQDLNNILGTLTKFEIRDGKLYIYPDPGGGIAVAIRYRSSLSLEEINTNYWIRRYTLAETKLVLGNIRSTFKSGIPGGTELIQLNGEDLIAQGTTEKAELLEEIKKMSEPLFLQFF